MYSRDTIIFPKYDDLGSYREISTASNIRYAKDAFQATIGNIKGVYQQWNKCRIRKALRKAVIYTANKIQSIGTNIHSKV